MTDVPELELLATVTGLPAGPVTEASVRAQLKITDSLDDATLVATINAVNARVLDFPYVARFVDDIDPTADNEWPADITYGATLLACRLFARRNSPDGVASFGDEGAVYIQRNDPDVAMLLRIGSYRQPAVG